METDDIFADDVHARRPVLCRGTALFQIFDSGQVVVERVKPDVHDMGLVSRVVCVVRALDAPLAYCARDTLWCAVDNLQISKSNAFDDSDSSEVTLCNNVSPAPECVLIARMKSVIALC